MCGSMADIQSPTADIRRGKERKKKKQDENIWSALLHRATIIKYDTELVLVYALLVGIFIQHTDYKVAITNV